MFTHTRPTDRRFGQLMLLLALMVGLALNLFGSAPAHAASGLVTVNDTDGAITYSGSGWYYSPNRNVGDIQNDLHATANNGDSVSYTFVGSGVYVWTEQSTDLGDVDVYLDGIYQGTPSAYGNVQNKPLYMLTKFLWNTNGTHTVKLVKKSGTWMVLDAFDVVTSGTTINDTDAQFQYSGQWMYSNGRGLKDYGDDVHATATNGDAVTFALSGAGFSVISEKSADLGEVDIYIDGDYQTTVNLYASTYNVPQQVAYIRTWTTSLSVVHTVKLVKKSGAWMVLDAIVLQSATALSPVTSTPPASSGPIWDVKAVRNSTDCGAGWQRMDQNLNEGAGGDNVYLCVSRTQGSQAQPINGLMACNAIYCQGGWTQVPDTDLNAGATDKLFHNAHPLYLYTRRGNDEPIQQIKFVTRDSEVEDYSAPCRENDRSWQPLGGGDLNQNVGGKYIYGCLMHAKPAQVPPSTIWDLVVITGTSSNISCPGNYTKDGQDLNQGAGGDYVYVCIDRTNLLGYASPIHYLTTGNDFFATSGSHCASQGGIWLDTNLNQNTIGDIINFCSIRQVAQYNSPGEKRLVDVRFAVRGSNADANASCKADFGNDYDATGIDLNKGAGGKYIFACQKRV